MNTTKNWQYLKKTQDHPRKTLNIDIFTEHFPA